MTYFLGLGGPYHHDASACLIDETGAVLAFAEEERFSRRKHHRNSRSCGAAVAYCLSKAGIEIRDVATVAVAWNPNHPNPSTEITDQELLRELLPPSHTKGHTPSRALVVDHHRAHAASAFYASGMSRATVVVVDGHGDGKSSSIHLAERTSGIRELWHADPSQSLGWLYESVAAHLGLGDWSSTGKLMGLASYGEPSITADFLKLDSDGPYRLDLTGLGLTGPSAGASNNEILDFYFRMQLALGELYRARGLERVNSWRIYDPGHSAVVRDHEIPQDHLALAASAQQWLQSALASLMSFAVDLTGIPEVCYAGGVALNCSANGFLRREVLKKADFFIQPAASDSGCALGAAYEALVESGRMPQTTKMRTTSFGVENSPGDIRRTLDAVGARYTEPSSGVAQESARLLAKGRVIGWVQGRAEIGPRALGHRSILADPRTESSRDLINRDIKKREMWRPLAPSILASAAPQVVESPVSSDFMIEAFRATPWACENLSGVVHVDGTLRPQFVDGVADPLYADLLASLECEIGIGAVLNTSFNGEDEPIVNNTLHALSAFFSAPIDALVIGPFVVRK
jgi:carbamoyltransferase